MWCPHFATRAFRAVYFRGVSFCVLASPLTPVANGLEALTGES